MERRHRSERISSEDIVKGAPPVPPELLTVLDHHPPDAQGTMPVLEATMRRGPPRWRGRYRPVERRADVEHGVHARSRRGEALGGTHQHVPDASVRNEEPEPVAPHEHALKAVDLARR